MMLYVNGQDIRELCLATWEGDSQPLFTQKQVEPDRFLSEIDAFLAEHEILQNDISGIVLVIGPGSATALRAIISIVSTWAWASKIPVYATEKPQELSDVQCLEAWMERDAKEVSWPIEPVYAHGPRITLSTKDLLGRKKTG